ncbi:MAG: creatininase family protein [Thermomicrobiaceae bacterium]|nr:creatininase family protein [Thermomicrobiaceae bacterium]
MAERRRLEEMSWPEVRAALDAGARTVLFAAGSMEQHGPHLPLQTDTLLGTALADALVERLPGVLRGPTVPFGVSEHHMAFPGTITLDAAAFKTLIHQYVASLARHGFEAVLVVPSHGGNFAPLRELEQETGGVIEGARFIPYTDLLAFLDILNGVAAEAGISPEEAGAHAGEAETSMVLAQRADLVDMARAAAGYVGTFDEAASRTVFERGMTALTPNGILGDARPATAERGGRYLERLADALAAYFQERLPPR